MYHFTEAPLHYCVLATGYWVQEQTDAQQCAGDAAAAIGTGIAPYSTSARLSLVTNACRAGDALARVRRASGRRCERLLQRYEKHPDGGRIGGRSGGWLSCRVDGVMRCTSRVVVTPIRSAV